MKILKKIGQDLLPDSSKRYVLPILMATLAFQFVFFAVPSLAEEINAQAANAGDMIIKGELLTKELSLDTEVEKIIQQKLADEAQKENQTIIKKEELPEIKVIESSQRRITAYNSDPRQTDSTPCITANGFNVCQHGIEDTIAANFLPFGTKVRIPELFGDRIFVVRDRMHPKNGQKVDIWMKNYSDAIKFGSRVAKIEIVEVN